jgi:hypothetical protein
MGRIGDLANLDTENRENLVAAINEVLVKVGSGGGLTVTDDGEGNVIISASGSTQITDDGSGNVVIA